MSPIPKEDLLALLEEAAADFMAGLAPEGEMPDVLRQQLPAAVEKALPVGMERQELEADILQERQRQEDIFRRVQRIQINASRAVNDVLAGEYVSVFKGRGMEFEEVRDYQPGDEVRTIDWNVTARMGHPFVKRFVEERELSVMLLVDASSSGDFGTEEKLKNDVAAEVCGILAFSAIRNNDKVGLIIFSDGIEKFVPPKKGKSHVLRVIRELLVLGARRPMSPARRRALCRIVKAVPHWPDGYPKRWEVIRQAKRQSRIRKQGQQPTRAPRQRSRLALSMLILSVGMLVAALSAAILPLGYWPMSVTMLVLATVWALLRETSNLELSGGEVRETDIAGALEYLSTISKRRAVVFLVSDFLAEGYEQQLRIANKRFDIVAITIRDPREITMPAVGMIELQDAETGEALLVDTRDTNVLKGFEILNAEQAKERSRLFSSMNVDEIPIRTDESPVDPIMRFFRLREHRL